MSGLAQKVAFLTPTGRVEKIYQQLTDFLGKAHVVRLAHRAMPAFATLRRQAWLLPITILPALRIDDSKPVI